MIIFFKILVVVSILVFVVGLIKPKWILFWMKEPDRLTVTTIGLALFMISWTGIAKLTLKPKERAVAERERSADEKNVLNLNRTR